MLLVLIRMSAYSEVPVFSKPTVIAVVGLDSSVVLYSQLRVYTRTIVARIVDAKSESYM